jgi:hypothetical protein
MFGSNHCLCEMQRRWTDDLCMCHSHREAWRRCNVWGFFSGDTVSDLFSIQGTLHQHGYHNIMQCYAIPSGLCLVGLSFVFQQDSDPKHLQAVSGLFDQEGEWWSAASDDQASSIWPRRRVMKCCIRWPGLLYLTKKESDGVLHQMTRPPLFDQEGEWWSAASDDQASSIWPRRRLMECCIRWPGLLYLTKKESDGVLHQMTWPPLFVR